MSPGRWTQPDAIQAHADELAARFESDDYDGKTMSPAEYARFVKTLRGPATEAAIREEDAQ